ncbi:hypothetical protein BD413DRAFT_608032 [Trametes elegans]|nr:hypothetical protein BD413DRAFT_608032 [Trametes elegans]
MSVLHATHTNATILASSLPKPLRFVLTAIFGAYLLFFSPFSPIALSLPGMSTTASLKGWHDRAHPPADKSQFEPTLDDLVFAVLLNAPADPEGFTLALFRPNLAVDASGRLLQLQDTDFRGLSELAEKTTSLPDTGSFLNTWKIAHDRTDQKIDRLVVPTGGGQKVTSVQGWSADKTKLATPVAEYDQLPPVLQELFEYIHEARANYQPPANKDFIEKVKGLVKLY